MAGLAPTAAQAPVSKAGMAFSQGSAPHRPPPPPVGSQRLTVSARGMWAGRESLVPSSSPLCPLPRSRPWLAGSAACPWGSQTPAGSAPGTPSGSAVSQEGVCAAGLEFERWLNATGPPLAEPDLSQGSSLTRPVEALFQLWTAEPLDQAAASASAIDISKWRTFQTALFLDRLLDGSPLPQGESRSCQGGRGGGFTSPVLPWPQPRW